MMSEEEEEEEDEEGEEDMANSGSHVNDALNQRDAMGGVLVNVGHPPDESDIYLAPQLAAVVKPHQVGFSFHLNLSDLYSATLKGVLNVSGTVDTVL